MSRFPFWGFVYFLLLEVVFGWFLEVGCLALLLGLGFFCLASFFNISEPISHLTPKSSCTAYSKAAHLRCGLLHGLSGSIVMKATLLLELPASVTLQVIMLLPSTLPVLTLVGSHPSLL